jgi:hypothetical protein
MALTTFTSGQVLTAAQLNAVQANDYNQTVSTKTASYTLVAADKGTRVVMNAAGATTITVNTSLFSAGDTLVIQNIGAGVTTVTAGTATVSSAGPLAIPENGSGTLYFTSAGVSIFYPSAGPAASSGLTFITSGTQSATATASITNIFTSSYTTYKIVLRNLSSSIANQDLRVRLGSAGSADTGANYNTSGFAGSTTELVQQSASATAFIGLLNHPVNALSFQTIEIIAPNVASQSYLTSTGFNTGNGNYVSLYNGMLDTSTQYTDFFIFLTSGNIGFSYEVFGYANS